MKRIEFRLSMPGRGSWNGGWWGEEKNYTITKKLPDDVAEKLLAVGSWFHRWDDGWCAGISAREMITGERRKKSDGFSGYEWMVDNILDHGDAYEKKAEVQS